MRQEHFCLLSGESQSEFDAMAKPFRYEYERFIDVHPAAGELLKDVLELKWRERRCRRRIDDLETELYHAENAD